VAVASAAPYANVHIVTDG